MVGHEIPFCILQWGGLHLIPLGVVPNCNPTPVISGCRNPRTSSQKTTLKTKVIHPNALPIVLPLESKVTDGNTILGVASYPTQIEHKIYIASILPAYDAQGLASGSRICRWNRKTRKLPQSFRHAVRRPGKRERGRGWHDTLNGRYCMSSVDVRCGKMTGSNLWNFRNSSCSNSIFVFLGKNKSHGKKKGNSETHPVPKSETNGWTYTWFKLLPSLNFPSPTEVTGFKMVCTNQNEWPWFWLKTALFWRVDPQN